MADNNPNEDEDQRRQNQINFVVEQQARIDANIESITERLDRLTADVSAFVVETRGAIQNLIVANEVTRDLAEQTARLAIQTSGRVGELEKE